MRLEEPGSIVEKKSALYTAHRQPPVSGENTNVIIAELKDTFTNDQWPVGVTAALITNELSRAIGAGWSGLKWEQIEEAYRFMMTHVPAIKVTEWARKLGKGRSPR